MKLFAMYARKLLQQKLVLRHTGKDFLINRYTIKVIFPQKHLSTEKDQRFKHKCRFSKCDDLGGHRGRRCKRIISDRFK
jgi:hypothetical protein